MLMLATTMCSKNVRVLALLPAATAACAAVYTGGALEVKRCRYKNTRRRWLFAVSERLVCVLNTSFFRFGLNLEYDSSIIQIDNQSSVTCSVIFSFLKGT